MEFLNIVIDFLNSRFSLILYLIAATFVLFIYALWNDSKNANDDDQIGFN